MTRVNNSIRNISSGIISTSLDMLSQFIIRGVFVFILGQEVYGLNSLFATIISILSLAEVGVGSVICFSLYKPIAENKQDEIIALMQLYKKYYRIIAFVILMLGILFIPFVPYFVGSGVFDIGYIYIIYSIFLFDAFASYFFSYNKTFLTAIQRNDVINWIRVIYLCITTGISVLALYLSKNFITYLILWTTFRILENATSYIYVIKHYPFLNCKKRYLLEEHKKQIVNKNIKALLFHKIGGILVLNSDSLILSRLDGIVTVGIYASYTMITSGIYKFTLQIFYGLKASIGDFAVQNNKENTKKLFDVLNFFSFLMYSWCSVYFINLCQPFMTLWMGENNTVSFLVLIVITVNFYMRGVRAPVDTFKDTQGIYWQDRYKPLVEGIVKIGFSLLLGYYMGFAGVLLGTTISSTLVLLTVEPYLVYKYAFDLSAKEYYINYAKEFLFTVVIIITTLFLNLQFINSTNLFITLIIRFLTCSIVPVIFIFLFFRKNENILYVKQWIMKRKIGGLNNV